MVTTFKDALEDLYARLVEAEQRHQGLGLDLVRNYNGEAISYRQWLEFAGKMDGPESPNVTWDYPRGDEIDIVARFHGNLDGYRVFQQLATEVFNCFCDTDPLLCRKDSYHGWLRMIYDMTTHCPSSGFETKSSCHLYLNPDLPAHENIFPSSNALSSADSGDEDGWNGPISPVATSYVKSPFQISCAALQMFITPYTTRFLREHSVKIHLVPWQLIAVFANSGVLRHTPAEIGQSGLRDLAVSIDYMGDYRYKPRFLAGPHGGGKLIVAGRVVRRFKTNATSLCEILQRFEDEGWPREIDNPVTVGDDPVKSGREFKINMNKRQEGPLRICFDCLKSGKKILQKVVKADPPSSASQQPPTGE